MKDGTVLNVDAVADGDGVDIAAQNGVEPDAAFVTYGEIADESGVLRQKTVFAYFGRKTADRDYQCHSGVMQVVRYVL